MTRERRSGTPGGHESEVLVRSQILRIWRRRKARSGSTDGRSEDQSEQATTERTEGVAGRANGERESHTGSTVSVGYADLL
ncbi:MAG: hypothetical protein ABEJ58_10865 [Halodesulfurarchaeum sp.]